MSITLYDSLHLSCKKLVSCFLAHLWKNVIKSYKKVDFEATFILSAKKTWLLLHLSELEGITYLTAMESLTKAKRDHQKYIRCDLVEVTVKSRSIAFFYSCKWNRNLPICSSCSFCWDLEGQNVTEREVEC